MQTGVEPPRGAFEGVAGNVDEAAGHPAPAGRLRGRLQVMRPAVQLGIPKQVFAVALGDQEQQCGMHRGLRFLRHLGGEASVTA